MVFVIVRTPLYNPGVGKSAEALETKELEPSASSSPIITVVFIVGQFHMRSLRPEPLIILRKTMQSVVPAVARTQ